MVDEYITSPHNVIHYQDCKSRESRKRSQTKRCVDSKNLKTLILQPFQLNRNNVQTAVINTRK